MTIILMLAAVLQILISCNKVEPTTPVATSSDLQMALISDPHFYDPALGITGEAFEAYLLQDRNLIAQSQSINESVIQALKTSNASIILIPGDLTKDGERINHERMAALLGQLESAGKKVFVVPGNHDIMNPLSFSYSGSTATPVPTITPAEFATLYDQFGYKEAFSRDPNSLSYVASLNSKTWLLAIDGCRYNDNTTTPLTDGRLSDATYQWIREKLAEAKTQQITVFGLAHHGLIEHYQGQSVMFPEYLIDDWQNKSPELASLGLKVFFSGHFHAQDVVKMDGANGSFMFDVETGSLVTWPVPYRTMKYTANNKLVLQTHHLTSLPGYPDFQNFAMQDLQMGMDTLIKLQLMSPPYNLSYEETQMLAPLAVSGFMAFYHGDEAIDPATLAAIQQLIDSGEPGATLGMSILSMYTDTAPGDQDIEIDLSSGVVTPL